jgi:hypothetical protein
VYEHPEKQSQSPFATIADVAAGNLPRRAAGVGLIAVGLIVQTIANVAALQKGPGGEPNALAREGDPEQRNRLLPVDERDHGRLALA